MERKTPPPQPNKPQAWHPSCPLLNRSPSNPLLGTKEEFPLPPFAAQAGPGEQRSPSPGRLRGAEMPGAAGDTELKAQGALAALITALQA